MRIRTLTTFLIGLTYLLLILNTGLGQTTEIQVSVQNMPPSIDNSSIECNEPIILTSGMTSRLSCNVTASDQNGWQDIYAISAVLWYNNTANITDSDSYANHYTRNTCNLTSGIGLERIGECWFDIQYFADPGEWTVKFNVTDEEGEWNASNISDITIYDFLALSASGIINFGSMLPGQISESAETAVINNTSNQEIDIILDGQSNINCTIGTIPLSNIHYDTLAGDYASMCGILSTNADDTCNKLSTLFNLEKIQTQTGSIEIPTKDIYWNIYVPEGVSGLCSGTVTYTAVAST